MKPIFKVGDKVTFTSEAYKAFRFDARTRSSLPWTVAKVSRDNSQIIFERKNKKGKVWYYRWAASWFESYVPKKSEGEQ